MSEEIENDAIPTEEEPKRLSYEDLEAELKRVRSEAASRRIANRELEEQARRWKEYEDSQKTELQKLQEALAEKESVLANYQLEKSKREVIDEFGLDGDDIDFLTGSDLDTIRSQAEKLKARNEKLKSKEESPRPVDFLAGNRGAPIGANSDKDLDTILRRMVKGR